MNWEKYGLRIGVQEESLSSSETIEAAVVALVGGQFQFPPNAILVSAVYAVSLSKPLLKPLQLEIQHCIDLTGRPDLAQYLNFAIAPVSTPSLPYQFSIVEGGEFSSNSGYGSIQRKRFCLVCILGEESTNGGGNGVPIASVNGDTEEGEEEEEEQQPQQEENEEEEEGEEQQLQHEEEGIEQQQQVEEQENNEQEDVQQEQEEEEEQSKQDKEEEEENEDQEEQDDEEGDKEGGEDYDDDSDSDNTSSTGPGASGAACKG